MKPGLVSITFRNLSPAAIITLCCENRLSAIEWGGDIHVPHGDKATAARVGDMTRDAGLEVAAYGSYYRLASPEGPKFQDVLASAVALAAPVIRVWAGTCGSKGADRTQRAAVADDALRCADLAAAHGITIAYEYHDGTLTDSTESALELLSATNHPFIKTLWQPPHGRPLPDCVASLRSILPRLEHIHVFHWWPDHSCRLPLADGRARWTAYLAELEKEEKDCALLLEFVPGDKVEALKEDASTLLDLCAR